MNDEPPLFKMDQPFPEMNGMKILVSTSKGSAIGELMTSKRKHKGLFGVKIRFCWASSAIEFKTWDRPLSEEEIQSIKEADHQDYKFAISLPMRSKSMESTSEADLYVDGQLVSTGEAVLYPSDGNGVFWPHDGKLLDAPYPEASLNAAGMPDAVRIKDVHQCSGNPSHWEFLIA